MALQADNSYTFLAIQIIYDALLVIVDGAEWRCLASLFLRPVHDGKRPF